MVQAMLLSLRSVRSIGSRPFTTAASAPTSKTQVYLSRSLDPYLNLSIEHHLLQTTHPESTVLFLYTNRPSIVIGRNQNPWLEVNLPFLRSLNANDDGPSSPIIELVRRRSGGGAVFHDEGNVNFSVICPPASFDRDKHAEMVVRALRSLGVQGANVNCRHDIVLDVPSSSISSDSPRSSSPSPSASCRTSNPSDRPDVQTFKISGSAYKLTRLRSLHHGTCLLSSPNLGNISRLLRSPGEPFMKARGVESVRSPVRNVGVDNNAFEKAVVKEFRDMYGSFDVEKTLGEGDASIESVAKGMSELRSRNWIYGQTPLFALSTYPTEDDARERPPLPGKFHLNLEARHGQIQNFSLGSASPGDSETIPTLQGSKIYDIEDWSRALEVGGVRSPDAAMVGSWLNDLFRTGPHY